MLNAVRQIHHQLSEFLAESIVLEEQNLVCVYLHKLYPGKKDVIPLYGKSSEGVTVQDFEAMVLYFKERGFQFVHDKDLLSPDLKGKKFVHISFDDGYFNNYLALPVLKKYSAKATIYICREHCETGKSFWWDVLARERSLQSDKFRHIMASEVKMLLGMRWEDQDDYIRTTFGNDALYGSHDQMRPMTRKELRELAQHPHIAIGNHTTHHQNLSLCTPDEIQSTIIENQQYIREVTGTESSSIAYPYGITPENWQDIPSFSDMRIGFTVEPGRNKLKQPDNMRMNRFQLSGFYSIDAQCRRFHHNFSLIDYIKNGFKTAEAW